MKIDLGGGNFPREGHVSVDIKAFTPETIVCDLENGILPFTSNSIEAIYADNCLEHIKNLIPLMNEAHRVLEDGGIFTIIVPLFPTIGAIKDPTHVRFFVPESFDYFNKSWAYQKQPEYGIKKWNVLSKEIEGVGDYQYLKVELQK